MQLDQVKKELKRTVYKPHCVTIASRDSLCTNKDVRENRIVSALILMIKRDKS